ncbi:mycofactocin biosynthesis glycosyltransferase MftF [Pseudoclavibacter endophyticus]|uniref:mycofactocin biosynthesis glycosyltransferase MftF n=1 Tax=Pseudoclavibacter endophyticus TaxID=1778590 RepID=UPI001CE49690|nr:mycofactocin biosynthesis glycosyltransferase MftF [Pseudoclavibacter endophyticus]
MRLANATRVLDGGAVLAGGTPSRVTRLREAATGRIRDRELAVADRASAALAGYLIDAGMADPEPASLPVVETGSLTVVIPAYRRSQPLERLLASIRNDLRDVRIIVVDDATPADEAEPLARAAADHGAELVRAERNAGPAAARNLGLARASTEFVLFIDTDAVLGPGAAQLLLRHFVDPKLGAAAPRIAALPRRDENWVLRYESARSSLDHGETGGLVRPLSPLSWVSSTCLLVRRAAVASGFEAGMRVGEDVDLVWRLHAAGWRVRYEPRAVVQHEHRRDVREWLERKFVYGTGADALATRHPGLVAPAVLAPWAVGGLVVLAAQRWWSLPVVGVLVAVTAARVSRSLPGIDRPRAEATRLTLTGFGWALTQGAALLLRHWWPIAVAAAGVSRRARLALVVAAVADAAWEYRRLRPTGGLLRFAIARRLDDLAYGAGVWVSAVRGRTTAPLLPLIRRRNR